MPRTKQMTQREVEALKYDGNGKNAQRHRVDGAPGLYLNIRPTGKKSWVQKLTVHGKVTYAGLGSYDDVSLEEARETASNNKRIARSGEDPFEKRGKRGIPTFRELAEEVIAIQTAATSAHTQKHWQSSLRDYAHPIIGDMRMDAITVDDVRNILNPIWNEKRDTAIKVRRRISTVFDHSVASGHRPDNPVDAVKGILPKKRVKKVEHHRALPYNEVADAIQTVWSTNAWIFTKLAFEFLVLTAARSGEVRKATWHEIDFDEATWTIPHERMKAGEAHRVPLSDRCIENTSRGARTHQRALYRSSEAL
ncbi:MAG: integrase arm-type DNA-binding domain-containing protein [Gammaproteobacteria bacterium]|nr:integrase arm-type DNA-binding domain-containing protein [Gammaproteobacteria bacterium]